MWNLILVALVLTVAAPSRSVAEEAETSAAAWGAAVLLISDVGLTVGNALSLATGTPDRAAGKYGIGAGALTLGLVVVHLIATRETEIQDGFTGIPVALGLVTMTLGGLALHASGDDDGETEPETTIVVSPVLVPTGDCGISPGIGVRATF